MKRIQITPIEAVIGHELIFKLTLNHFVVKTVVRSCTSSGLPASSVDSKQKRARPNMRR